MREPRFFVEPIADDQCEVIMSGPEAHHLKHVLRLQIGERVILFDGSDVEFSATIDRAGKHEIALTIQERRSASVEASRPVVIASAVPKGDRQQWLIEKLVELGVAGWIPVSWRHSAVKADAKSTERWRRYVIEASKQCRRNRLMLIGDVIEGNKLLASPRFAVDSDSETEGSELAVRMSSSATARWLLDPSGEVVNDSGAATDQGMWVAIGPEGGFADDELRQGAEADWQLVSWGPRILRLETAAIAVAASLLKPKG